MTYKFSGVHMKATESTIVETSRINPKDDTTNGHHYIFLCTGTTVTTTPFFIPLGMLIYKNENSQSTAFVQIEAAPGYSASEAVTRWIGAHDAGDILTGSKISGVQYATKNIEGKTGNFFWFVSCRNVQTATVVPQGTLTFTSEYSVPSDGNRIQGLIEAFNAVRMTNSNETEIISKPSGATKIVGLLALFAATALGVSLAKTRLVANTAKTKFRFNHLKPTFFEPVKDTSSMNPVLTAASANAWQSYKKSLRLCVKHIHAELTQDPSGVCKTLLKHRNELFPLTAWVDKAFFVNQAKLTTVVLYLKTKGYTHKRLTKRNILFWEQYTDKKDRRDDLVEELER